MRITGRRLRNFALGAAALLLGLPALVLAGLLVFTNLPAGQRLLVAALPRLTGGAIRVAGLSGRFPDRLRLVDLQVADASGAWIVLHGVALDWSPLALAAGKLRIAALTAQQVEVLRLPKPAPGAGAAPAAKPGPGFTLPLPVALARLHIARLVLAPAIAKLPAGMAAPVFAVQGAADLQTLLDGTLHLAVQRQDAPGEYRLDLRHDAAGLAVTLRLEEKQPGLLATFSGLAAPGGLHVAAQLAGPDRAARLQLAATAGSLHATAQGLLDLPSQAGTGDIAADTSQMAPLPGVSWGGMSLRAHFAGTLAHPQGRADLQVRGLAAGGANLAEATAQITGDGQLLSATASLAGLRLPGPAPDLLAAAPVQLAATLHLDAPGRPAEITLSHPILNLTAKLAPAPALAGDATLILPDLAPFAQLGGVDLRGKARLDLHSDLAGATRRLALHGQIGVVGGAAPWPALIGPAASISAEATLSGADLRLQALQVQGQNLDISAEGSDIASLLSLRWHLALADLHAVSARLSGTLAARGDVSGPLAAPGPNLAASADITSNLAVQNGPRGSLHLAASAHGLPATPVARVQAYGTLDGAKLQVDARLRRPGGAWQADIAQATWKSLALSGTLRLAPGQSLPDGAVQLRIARLDDLAPLLGLPLAGSVSASLQARGAAGAKLDMQAGNLVAAQGRIGRLHLAASVAGPVAQPVAQARLSVEAIAMAGLTGRMQLAVAGPENALSVTLGADLRDAAGAPAVLHASARADGVSRRLALAQLQADWHGLALRLLGPAGFDFAGGGVAVDRLRLGLGAARLDLGGRVLPVLNLHVALRDITPALAAPFLPAVSAAGVAQADAQLAGTLARPTGNLHLAASGLHLQNGPAASLPPASLTAAADLAGDRAKLDVAMQLGASQLALRGTAPLATSGALALSATGRVDLALLNPILTAQGRHVQGIATLAAGLAGSIAAPVLSGTLRLAQGAVQDFTQGIRITDIAAEIAAVGPSLRIAQFRGTAGTGQVAASGTLGVLAPGLPVDLAITAHQARLLDSDLLRATLDADLSLRGHARALDNAAPSVKLAGHVEIDQASIRLPDSLPPSVATLNVVRAGQKPPPPPAPGLALPVDLALRTRNVIIVRGHGLDAELAGKLHLGGTLAQLQPEGGFTLQHGTLSLAGTTLNFTQGRIGFDTGDIANPSIDFVATNAAGNLVSAAGTASAARAATTGSAGASNVVATLRITGDARAPKLLLSSVPALPQDQVLAYLLFGQGSAQLSVFQLASIAQALASFGGVGGGLADPLGQVRSLLGLDRLAVEGGGANGSTPTLSAGRYVAPGVYLGARQGTSGTDTQATLQLDITKRLKAETDVGSGLGGNSVGLTYQFQY